ncbi:MAG: hypothetical protein ACJ8F1_01995 [Polyangia bacterium]
MSSFERTDVNRGLGVTEVVGSLVGGAVGRAILAGGACAALLDGLDAIVAYKLALGLGPLTIYQFVASGLLGPAAYQGGLASALVGVAVHCLIAFSAATVFVVASRLVPRIAVRFVPFGALFGVAVFAVMNYLVIPQSRIPPAPFSAPLFLNGIIGHALFVGIPIAYAAHRANLPR